MAGSLVHTRAPAAALRTPGPGVRNFVGGAMDSNSFPRPTHNVRRPRKHCVSDTPGRVAHRAALSRRVKLKIKYSTVDCISRARARGAIAPSSKVHPIAAAERPCLRALARLHRARATATAAWATPRRVHRCQLSARLPRRRGFGDFKYRHGTRFFVLHIMVHSWCAQNDAQNRCA